MKYKKQTKDTCLAYAMWQVGMIGDEALEEYVDAFEGHIDLVRVFNDFVEGWLDRYVPSILLDMVREVSGVTVDELDVGSGIVIVRLVDYRGSVKHAVSYEDGMLLDPDYTGVRETFDDLVVRFNKQGMEVELVNILPSVG